MSHSPVFPVEFVGNNLIMQSTNAKLYWCCAKCGHVEEVAEQDDDCEYSEGDEETCVHCIGGTARVALLDSPDDFIGG